MWGCDCCMQRWALARGDQVRYACLPHCRACLSSWHSWVLCLSSPSLPISPFLGLGLLCLHTLFASPLCSPCTSISSHSNLSPSVLYLLSLVSSSSLLW